MTIHSLLFDINRSIRYHDRRMAFYDNCRVITNALTMIMSSVVIIEIASSSNVSNTKILIGLGVISAALSLVDLAIGGYGKRAEEHKLLRKRFSELKQLMIVNGHKTKQLPLYKAERSLIENDEPPIYVAVDCLCHNEQMIADGYTKENNPDEFATITFWQRLTSDFYRWPNMNPRQNR